jgi:hypothetical protein
MPTLAWIHHGPSCRLFKMRPHYPKNPSFRVARLSNHLAVANALLDVDFPRVHAFKQWFNCASPVGKAQHGVC